MALLTLPVSRGIFAGSTRRARFWLATLVWSVLASKSWAETDLTEYQLKAIFLFNFAQFVEWPQSAFPGERSPLTIGIVGDDPFDGLLDDVVRGEKVGEREIVVRRLHNLDEVDGCQILFIGKSESSRLEWMINALGNRALLTVSDAERAARRGAMILFVNERKKIRLRINLEAVQRAGLVVSSKLLRAAEIVTTDHPRP